MSWYNITVNLLLPAAAVTLLFFLKRRLLWLAPLISTGLMILIGIHAMPSVLTAPEHSAFFWRLLLPLHIGVDLWFVGIAYAVAYALCRRDK